MEEGGLPPGFRFSPTDEELLCFYLSRKIDNPLAADLYLSGVIPVVNIYESDPPDLPAKAGGDVSDSGETEWYFFCPRQQREGQGGRSSRLTPSGYWKATGSPSSVFSHNRKIGKKSTLVFYRGRAPTGTKTPWKMNELRLLPPRDGHQPVNHIVTSSSNDNAVENQFDDFTVCRVYTNSGHMRAFDRRPLAP